MDQTDNFAFLVPLMMTTFGVVFLIMGFLRMRSAWAWGLGFFSAGLAFFMPILPLQVEVTALSADALFIAAFFFYGEALLQRFGGPQFLRLRLGFSGLAFAGALVAVIGFRNLNAELLVVDTSISILLAFSVALVARRAKGPVNLILVVFSGLVVADTMIRLVIFTFFVNTSSALEDFAASPYSYFMQVSVGAMCLCFALSAMASLVVDRMEDYREAAERDPLTGLLNRRGFDRAVTALRSGGVLLNCDIDHFKDINDGFGHGAGDRVIAGLGQLLAGRVPKTALAARFGGEEFVILLPGTDLAGGAAFAQSLRMSFAATDWSIVGVERQITLSFGIAALGAEESSVHDAIERADRALYAAKAAGRNRVMLSMGQDGSPAAVGPTLRSAG